MARGLDFLGELPADFGSVLYPTFKVVDGTEFLAWNSNLLQSRPSGVTGGRLWVGALSRL